MNFYKSLLKTTTGQLVSSAADGKAEVEYEIGRWVKAPDWLAKKGYHLCVFDSLDTAKGYGHQVWECEVEFEVKLPKLGILQYLALGELYTLDGQWINGTRMFKRVKILKKVE